MHNVWIGEARCHCDKETFVHQYEELFKGLGKISGKCSIKLKENSEPSLHYNKRIPSSLIDPLRKRTSMTSLSVVQRRPSMTSGFARSSIERERTTSEYREVYGPYNLCRKAPTGHKIRQGHQGNAATSEQGRCYETTGTVQIPRAFQSQFVAKISKFA